MTLTLPPLTTYRPDCDALGKLNDLIKSKLSGINHIILVFISFVLEPQTRIALK